MKLDRFTKVLLTLLVIGVWGSLLRPFFNVPAANAQSSARKRYVLATQGTFGEVQFGGDGAKALSASHFAKTLKEAPEEGWRLHSFSSRVMKDDRGEDRSYFYAVFER